MVAAAIVAGSDDVGDVPSAPARTMWDADAAMANLAEMLFGDEVRAYQATVDASDPGVRNAQIAEPASYPDSNGWTAFPGPGGSWEVNTGHALYLVFEDDRQPVRLERQPSQ